jgi:micrococcal nuclease
LCLTPALSICTVSSSPYKIGDTIEVLRNKHSERIRLNGVDCPENGQAYGKRAKQAASALVFGKDVSLQTFGKDKYGRTIADVFLPDGTNINHQLVKDGWCCWYRKYAPLNTELEKLEQNARDVKKGLWIDPTPVPPWVYRKVRHWQQSMAPIMKTRKFLTP